MYVNYLIQIVSILKKENVKNVNKIFILIFQDFVNHCHHFAWLQMSKLAVVYNVSKIIKLFHKVLLVQKKYLLKIVKFMILKILANA